MGLCSSNQSANVGGKPPKAKSIDVGKNLVAEKKNNFNDVYEIVERGEDGGAEPTVSKVRRKQQANHGSFRSVVYALKEVDTSSVEPAMIEEMRNEINIIKSLDHPNIVKAFETYDIPPHTFAVVMELCTGGDLRQRKPYTEEQAATVVQKVLGAVQYLHKKKIIHRDLRPQTIAFENDSEEAEIKLISFGLSSQYSYMGGAGSSTSKMGSIYSTAPEALQGYFSPQADMWSLGVLTYELISGHKPFMGSSTEEIISNIQNAQFDFDGPKWKYVTSEAKDFIKNLLQTDTFTRWTPEKALKSEWMKGLNDKDREAASQLLSSGKFEESIKQYAQSGDMNKIALHIIAHKSTSEEVVKLRAAFREFDEDNDGCITKKEFKAVLSKYGYDANQIEEMFRSLDVDGSGTVMYTEFLAALLQNDGNIEKDRIAEAFAHLDSDGDGEISAEELRQILKGSKSSTSASTEKQIEEMIQAADADGNGQISCDEFLQAFAAKSSEQSATAVEA